MSAPFPAQPGNLPFPTEAWPEGTLPEPARRRLLTAADYAFSETGREEIGETLSLLVVHGGRLVFERYGSGVDLTTPLPSWSMAKSLTHALVGLLVGDGRLQVGAPAQVSDWSRPEDPRREITLDHLLRMSSGLKFTEVYVQDQGSDVIEMLFGSGKSDVGGFAAQFPLVHPPGRVFAYSSGTTNIICRMLRDLLGGEADLRRFMQERLFGPLGMRTPAPRFDAAGVFIGSSYCAMSAQDFARFGLLYLRDGMWGGERVLPTGWADHARTLTPASRLGPDGPYGAHWWLETGGPDTFSANGYEGQFIVLAPRHDLILVRNGRSPLERKEPLAAFIRGTVEAIGQAL